MDMDIDFFFFLVYVANNQRLKMKVFW